MIAFLDSVYLTCCSFYRKKEPYMFKISGLLLLAGVLVMNLILGIFLLQDFGGEAFASGAVSHARWVMIGGYLLIILPALSLRYFKYTEYEHLDFRFQTRSHAERNGYRLASLAYIALSIASTLGYAFYCGGAVSGFWH
ncbi:hypothetical protein ACFP2F_22880 [Hymenobacter artigasi]|uniref:Uncharacterized protein n=1 Tax=Hymenobacter artigasi TaxID=2719616 RepID=A0ABX1HRP8_9BACT|nr:hypothetical protein [Hymenobacter artigasi]NKI92032.1 hypothetical protein [Hymenobacter artigasi]